MRLLISLVDWKRALLLLPVLLALGIILYLVAWRDSTAATPRASLLETTASQDLDVGTAKGQMARDFLASTWHGEEVRLSDLRGTPVIINFWASWCTSCLAEIPDLRGLQEEFGVDRLRVVAVNVGESADGARRFIEDLDAQRLQAVLDPTLVVADAYGVRGMPQTVFVDAEGVIRTVYIGHLTDETMREYANALTSGTELVERDGPLRLVTTVARERVLDVVPLDDGRVEFRSKSLRCDDAYCAQPVFDAIASAAGVVSLEERADLDPARVVVTFDEQTTDIEALADVVALQLTDYDDPLYTRPLDVRFP